MSLKIYNIEVPDREVKYADSKLDGFFRLYYIQLLNTQNTLLNLFSTRLQVVNDFSLKSFLSVSADDPLPTYPTITQAPTGKSWLNLKSQDNGLMLYIHL